MPFAFISSPVKGLYDVRGEIHRISLPDGQGIYVDERDHPRGPDEPSLVTIEDLFRHIREAPAFVVILATERHGSPL